ncbi:DNA gyrase inhibitor YacG [Thermodesulfobacteriota bacterium]
MAIVVKCPVCKKQAVYLPENPYRPFCSERCRYVDLGQWLEEDHCIPGEYTLMQENLEDA